jgi:hypothetical protein
MTTKKLEKSLLGEGKPVSAASEFPTGGNYLGHSSKLFHKWTNDWHIP